MNRWIVGLIAGAISLIAAVGCGGGDDSTTTITKAEFTKQADAICAKSKKAREAGAAEMDEKYYELVGRSADPEKQVAKVGLEKKLAEETVDNSYVPAMKEQLEGFEELGAPPGDEAKVSEIAEIYSEIIQATEDEGLKVLLGDQRLAEFQEKAEAYGLNCPF